MEKIPWYARPKKSTRVRFEIALDAITDADIVKKLDSVLNKSDYVRKLIRDDIKKGSQ